MSEAARLARCRQKCGNNLILLASGTGPLFISPGLSARLTDLPLAKVTADERCRTWVGTCRAKVQGGVPGEGILGIGDMGRSVVGCGFSSLNSLPKRCQKRLGVHGGGLLRVDWPASSQPDFNNFPLRPKASPPHTTKEAPTTWPWANDTGAGVPMAPDLSSRSDNARAGGKLRGVVRKNHE